jgi:hypothetical protein
MNNIPFFLLTVIFMHCVIEKISKKQNMWNPQNELYMYDVRFDLRSNNYFCSHYVITSFIDLLYICCNRNNMDGNKKSFK